MNHKLFTLVEVLVTSLITGFILAGVATYLLVTYDFNNKINYQTMVHSILENSGREIEESVKKGSVLAFYNQDVSLLPDSAFQEIAIYRNNESGVKEFYKGYLLEKDENITKLYRTNEAGNKTGEVVTYANADFSGSTFFKKPESNVFISFDLQIVLYNKDKKVYESEKLYFYAKCRN